MYVCIGVCLESAIRTSAEKFAGGTVVSLWFVQACDLTSYTTLLPEITSKKTNISIHFFKVYFHPKGSLLTHEHFNLITCKQFSHVDN